MWSSYVPLLLSALSLSVLAAPAPMPAELDRRAVSQELFDRLNLFEQFTAASYCKANSNSGGDKLLCAADNCPMVEADETHTVLEFENSRFTDATGYVAVDTTRRLIIVAFRGTASIKSFLADALFLQMDVPELCTGCKAFRGFVVSWREVRDQITAAVQDAAADHPGFKVVVVGHSLGAGIAAVAVAELRNGGFKDAAMYTYGGSRIGNEALSTYITNQAGGNYRVTHKDDTVPRLPPPSLGYVHISPEYYISSGQNVVAVPEDITVCEGSANTTCGNGGNTGMNVAAHLWYFNSIAACFINIFPKQ